MDARILAEKIKQSVSCQQVFEANGIKVNRHVFCVCPFHGDTDASLKIYGDRWHCFGCNRNGDVITIARELYNVGFMDAIRRLNEEFAVGLEIDGQVSERDKALWAFKKAMTATKQKAEKAKEKKLEDGYLNSLSMFMWLDGLVQDNEPDNDDEWSPLFCGYLQARAAAREQLTEYDIERMALNGR